MRAYVFPDRALERHAGRCVWLSIDTEKEQNVDFLTKYPISAYPTLLIVNPEQESILIRWLGAVTVPQLGKLLDDGDRALAGAGKGADAALAKADKLMGDGNNDKAASAYEKALAKAPPGWPSKDLAVESLLTVLSLAGKNEECVRVAHERLPKERSPHFAAVAASGLGCSLELEGPAQTAGIAEFEPAARSAVADPPIAIAVDDLSSIHGLIVSARDASKDAAGAKAAAKTWLEYLESEAAKAATPEERAVFDPHRLSAAIEAGDPARAVAALEQSEENFPTDYNPPARLAIAFKEMGELDRALAAADRALARVYGPRKIRVYLTKADVLSAKGDKPGALATLEQALAYAKSLPAAQGGKRTIESLQARIDKAKSPA